MPGRDVSSASRIVSSEAEELILVDADDRETGHLSKAACHDGSGILHRAFSVFLFNDAGDLLLQQRATSKRLWPGFWSNSCCSHPRRGESMEVATQRRLGDELNAKAVLEYVYKFRYQANFGDLGSEHELCHVFLGRLQSKVLANDEEIAAIRFVGAKDLDAELAESPERYTPWFKLEWEALKTDYGAVLSEYLPKRTYPT
jgi:isopentenyl-diphosphate delta-isomerase